MTCSRSVLFIILMVFHASFTAYAQTAPASSPKSPHDPDCEIIPEPQVPLAQVVPRCMSDRNPTRDPVELIAQDLIVCGCLQQGNALFPESLTPTQPTSRSTAATRYATSTANNIAISTITKSSTNERASSRLLGSGLGEIRQRHGENAPKISSSLADMDSIQSANQDAQCVTYLEYSAQRELPYDNSFFTFLSSTTSFNANDWKLDSLRAAYDATTNADVRRSIQMRMVFLSRNPQYAALFSARTVEGVPAATVTARQQDLFRLLRTLAPPASSSCGQTENACWRDAQASGAYREFSAGAEELLTRNDTMDIVSAQTASNYLSQLTRINSTNENEIIPRTPAGYSNYLQSAQQDIAFGCTGPTAQATCYERFANHCNQVRKIHSRATSPNSGEDVLDEISSAEVVHGLLTVNRNQSFDNFNDLICRQQYSNANGEQSNFFQYRTRVCAGASAPPECSDRREILARFLEEYNVDDNAANSNIRIGFSQALKRPRFVEITRQQIEAVNLIAESPRALRARFGGEMPTLSGSGQLIVPTGSTSRTATPTPSSVASSSSAVSGLPNPTGSASVAPVSAVSQAAARSPASESRSRPAEVEEQSTPSSRAQSRPQENRRPSAPLFAPNPQPISSVPIPSVVAPVSQRSQATSDSDDQERTESRPTSAPAASSGIVQSAGGGGSVSSGPVSSLSTPPQIELPPRRARGRSSDSIRNALLGKYENVSEDQGSTAQRALIDRPATPIPVNSEAIANVMNDLNSLSGIESVMTAVNASEESIVKLSLEPGEDGTSVVVYAAKVNGQVTFSFTPPEASAANNRAPASLGENEMNVRAPDQNFYQNVSRNPAMLANYESVVRSAMTLPGDVVRLNLVVDGQEPVFIYVDKRGPRPVFTSDNQDIIRAYRP